MPCFRPMKGYRSRFVNANGKRPITFNVKEAFEDMPLTVPCGQCIGCRLERSRQWAIRCMHEAQMHEENCFITLTYNDQNLVKNSVGVPILVKKDFQDFMKRLRERTGKKIRYYHCGEYGDNYGRPHYHAIIFGLDFNDKVIYKKYRGNLLYTSELLNKVWKKGFATIGEVSFETAAYVARYIIKKVTGKMADDYYTSINPETGEWDDVTREYTTMSRKPGIAHGWFQKYKDDVFPEDQIIIRGKEMKPPRYYDNLYEHKYSSDLKKVKGRRKKNAKKHSDNNLIDRLRVREKVAEEKVVRLKRKLY